METEKPLKQWCERHWKPIKDSYDPGSTRKISGIAAQIYLMATVMGDEEFALRMGHDPVSATVMNALLAEISPVCCWIGDEGMEQLYKDCEVKPDLSGYAREHKTCSTCGIEIFSGAYDRKKKESIWIHYGGAWTCEQAREVKEREKRPPGDSPSSGFFIQS